MEFENDPSILDPNEVLLIKLMNPDLRWSRDICDYKSNLNGFEFSISGSHIERRSGGGIMGAMLGTKSTIVEDYWTYRLRMARRPGGSALDGIEISTGDFDETIDELLCDLYWFAHDAFHTASVDCILEHLK